jgi:glucokinase
MKQIVAADIGGTHARFTIATLDGRSVASLGEAVTLRTGEHASFETAWEEFQRRSGGALPQQLAMAVAGPLGGETLQLTNNPWAIRPGMLRAKLAAGGLTIVNDFGAVAHAVAALGGDAFKPICGPDRPLPSAGVITILGPGTGLGVAALLRNRDGYDVIESEGGHIDFAPLDSLDDRILAHLRSNFRRVSVERLISGRGLMNIYEALGAIEGQALAIRDDRSLWAAALKGSDSLAAAALERFCLCLGAVAGDLALVHGASAVVIGGGVGLRLANHLPKSGFASRFIAKGRFERRMADIPVKLITYPQPGLFGAAAAFAHDHA